MGLNYAIPEVQEHMAATIVEIFEDFQVDGVELDFMRHPAFFQTSRSCRKPPPYDRYVAVYQKQARPGQSGSRPKY